MMAEGPDPVVADLEQEVTCGICHDRYQEPKLLPCCHYYCKQCILTLSSRYRPNQPFPCPDCREPTLLPDNNPDRLTTAFFINRMKALHSRMEKAHGKLETTCEMCSGGKATAFCRQCVNFICEDCVRPHQRMKVFATHIVSTLEQLKQGGVKELTFENPPPPKCEDHEELKKIFCFDCNKLICRDCIVIEHAGHNYEFVKKAAPATRKKLTEHLSPLKNLLPDLSTAVNQVKGTKQKIQAQKELTERQVNAKFQELHDILDQCKVRVLRKSSVLADSKMEKLTVQEKGLDLSLGTAQSLIAFVERTLENASDEELITMQSQVVSRIDAEVVKRGKEAANLDPVEKDDFEVEGFVSEDLKKLCENNVFVYEGKVDPTKFTVEGNGARTAEISTLNNFSILVECNTQFKHHTIQVALKSLVEESSQQLQAVPVRDGVYSVEYTPRIRGRHHLLISVDNQPIPGSPFSVFVKIPPTKLDKPVRVIRGINNPRYMAFNSSEELIVTDRDSDVLVLDKKGERIRSISKSKHGFSNISGVAVDKEDNIYVCDNGESCVYKFNKREDLLKRFGTRGIGPKELNWPRGIAVAGDQVFVCDQNNHRVQVLTTERLVKQIGSKGTGNGHFNGPEDIAVDNEQMVYVTDYSNHRVQVLTMGGRFIRSIGKKGSGQGDLSRPHGVCVTSFVYVADFDNNRVSVFTKDGQFVTSFGNGHITSHLYGVAVDNDGFVYVCSDGSVIIF
ncbi:E3 ubiquitin-protein ligase TRIM71-like [Halichondria panicea]|uniref:E3 ubiquitin-protein ligase TRIM71-like n=1 Tax=Halichondria panicea TaxID=6063 RepID=UPI00312B7C92